MNPDHRYGLSANDQKTLDALTAKRQAGACAAAKKTVDETIAQAIEEFTAAGAIITDANVQSELSILLNVLIHHGPKLSAAIDTALAGRS